MPLAFSNVIASLARTMMRSSKRLFQMEDEHLPSVTRWVLDHHSFLRWLLVIVGAFCFVAVIRIWRSRQTEPEKLASLLWISTLSLSLVLFTLFFLLLAFFLPGAIVIQEFVPAGS